MKRITNALALAVFWIAGLTTVVVLGAVILYVFVNGIGHLNLAFIFTKPHGVNAEGGIWPMIVSTLYVTGLAMVIVTPIAVLAAVYLAEYAVQGRLVRIIRFAADTLAGVPSIVMGLFGLALFVEGMGFGFSVLSGALALSFLMLPIVMRTTEEAIRAVPKFIRWGSYGLGATKWQTVSRIVLPAAMPRIITGLILATGRAVGETAVVIFTMGTMINTPLFPSDPGRSMTVHLYQMAMEGINLPAAFGTALLLMVMILFFNLSARWLLRRNRRMQG
ncbi:MAG: phosphate ABC transporter, permease protein PstA [Actinobacteria bacterium HGW-Actinobacteria-1]|jgi:phosphate transport system permease protein|nr:MAG: phosphate ABC transporter, permease protein PstA [Actinobacteria bacterium HGW-Actinobacteria-1]